MNDTVFITKLSELELLPGNMDAAIQAQATQVDKAKYFIDFVINPSLDTADNSEYPERLLVAMKESGFSHVSDLANKMTSEIGSSEDLDSRTGMS